MVTYDLVQPYFRPNRDDRFYLDAGRLVTLVGVVLSIGTALLASQFNNIMNYLQALFSIFNAPIFATFILGMFWKRSTGWGGFWGLLTGSLSGATLFLLYEVKAMHFGTALSATFAQAVLAFGVDTVVTVAVSLRQPPPDRVRLEGVVAGVPAPGTPRAVRERTWWQRRALLGSGAIAAVLVLNVLFA